MASNQMPVGLSQLCACCARTSCLRICPCQCEDCATCPRQHAHLLGLFASRLCCAQLINAALDISALFDARTDVVARMTRFTSRAAPGVLLARVEEAAHALGGRTRRRDDTRCSPATLLLSVCAPSARG